jgi:hypothetical protein
VYLKAEDFQPRQDSKGVELLPLSMSNLIATILILQVFLFEFNIYRFLQQPG